MLKKLIKIEIYLHDIAYIFKNNNLDGIYHTSPELSNWVWITSSVFLAMTGSFGIISNVCTIVAYIKNSSVRYLYRNKKLLHYKIILTHD